jgi:hypothetical protein
MHVCTAEEDAFFPWHIWIQFALLASLFITTMPHGRVSAYIRACATSLSVTSIEITHKYITNLYIERDVAIDRTQPGT